MPELPEVEITVRRLAQILEGAEVESAIAPGMVTMKTFDPPVDVLMGRYVAGTRRFGKMPVVDFALGPDADPDLSLLVHLMSAGRLQVFDKRASLKDRASRLLIRLTDGRELRLREFGTRQRAWAKLLAPKEVARDEQVSTLGPEAWPPPSLEDLAETINVPSHLHPLLRKQRVIAGIGRQWADEVLWEAKLSPFQKGSELNGGEIERLHGALHVLGDAIDFYEEKIDLELPNKMPLPLQVHKQEGKPCPRCGTTIEAIFYSDHQTNYCPTEQTGGRVLKDRRLSRLLK